MRRYVSGFLALDWQFHYSNTRNGAILVDTVSRALHYCSDEQTVYNF